ncbi:phosphotransferase enzyme family [Fusarium tjaetaba]|uniref:Phosphotransferase enzyme family n=1 Tax=Fusarium tjaetaba TaxID=1567544 RepID=A0A8H5RWR8_9HYPO|nr:phosphotransferase enzyme family [Fusarium tjaetaba]KAF5642236.1 phosphotransferase enzyme family [Fusarium tjaetaba]
MTSTLPDIDSKVRKALEGTKFEVSELMEITGGSVNWIYKAKLLKPLDNGEEEVLVKHGERYMASKPESALPPIRRVIETESLKILSSVSLFDNRPKETYSFIVRTPELYHFDPTSSTQILESMPDGIHLKDYAIQNYGSPTPDAFKPQCQELGKAIGKWLQEFAIWSGQQVQHRDLVAQNAFGQHDILTQVEQMAAAEKEDTDKLQIIHGDFWTGNVVLPDAAIKEGTKIPVFVVDWEMTQLGLPSVDVGQMIAEMYALSLYKSVDAGLWMMGGFIEGYGDISEDFAFRTAIHVGTHLVCVTTDFPAWGHENYARVVEVGRDIIVHAWEKDRDWFQKGDLACLFQSYSCQ